MGPTEGGAEAERGGTGSKHVVIVAFLANVGVAIAFGADLVPIGALGRD